MGEETALAVREDPAGRLPEVAELTRRARDFMAGAKADNTRRAYRADWNDFTRWCELHARESLPASPETVALYLTDRAETHKPSTLQRRLSALSQAHQAAGHETPTKHPAVRAVWQGIKRAKGTAQEGKAPALTAEVRRMVRTLPDNLLGARDRALLLVGFAGAFRRGELVALDVRDVERTADGLAVTVRRGKTDPEGQGRKVGIPYGSHPETCPVRAYAQWLERSGVTDGPVFRGVNRHGRLAEGRLSDKAVALVVKRSAEAAGLDPKRYAGHSLRAGLATSAAQAGASERSIMAQTGHKSVTIARRYIREGSLFRENAAAIVGL